MNQRLTGQVRLPSVPIVGSPLPKKIPTLTAADFAGAGGVTRHESW